MIQIPPSLPDPSIPRRPEGSGVQAVPAVLADKAGANPGVVLNLPNPVLETPTDGMRAKDATLRAGATQIDSDGLTPAVRLALAPDVEVAVRPGLNTAELPERLAKLLVQLEKFSEKAGVPVLWPAGAQVTAARPDLALFNLRQALGGSMLFEVQRLQTRFVPSASSSERGGDEGGPVQGGGGTVALAAAALLGASEEVPVTPSNGGPLAELPDSDLRPDVGGSKSMPSTSPVAEKASSSGMIDSQGVATVRRDPASSVVAGATPAVDPLVEGAGEAAVPAEVGERAGGARRAETLNADSPSIRDAVRLLLQGELRWQGELSPGVFGRLQREDVWEEDSHAPGALVKGTMVSVDVVLPTLGRVRVRGVFFKDSVRVTVLPDESARNTFQAEFQELRDRLAGRGLEAAQVRLLEKGNG